MLCEGKKQKRGKFYVIIPTILKMHGRRQRKYTQMLTVVFWGHKNRFCLLVVYVLFNKNSQHTLNERELC